MHEKVTYFREIAHKLDDLLKNLLFHRQINRRSYDCFTRRTFVLLDTKNIVIRSLRNTMESQIQKT